MKKFSLLLLDANVVIRLFELGMWDRVVETCDVHLTQIVTGEADFFDDDSGIRHSIDLDPYEESGRITVHEIPVSMVAALTDRFEQPFLRNWTRGKQNHWHC